MKTKTSVGRPTLPLEEKRKARSIKMSDLEWQEIQTRAARANMNVSQYIRSKLLNESDIF